MINLLNKILSRFNLKLVSTKPDTRLVDETVKFLNTFPESSLCDDDDFDNLYAGDITFVKDKTGKTYFRQEVGRDYKYFDYDGDTYTTEQLQEKLNYE